MVDGPVLDAVLADYTSERAALSRSLLGAGGDAEPAARPGPADAPVPRPGLAPRAHGVWTSYRPHP